MPVDDFQAAFQNGKLIRNSIFISEQLKVKEGEEINLALQILSINPYDLVYFNKFKDAEIEFFKKIDK